MKSFASCSWCFDETSEKYSNFYKVRAKWWGLMKKTINVISCEIYSLITFFLDSGLLSLMLAFTVNVETTQVYKNIRNSKFFSNS